MAELGSTLSRVRRARGISLEDAERDTHVSRRYLLALETEDFSVFPAPVYARGFLRTYARYLGINPDELIASFPSGEQPAEIIAPLPTVSRPPAPMVNVNWLIAAIIGIFLVGAALLLLQGSGNGTVTGNSGNGQDAELAAEPPDRVVGQVQSSAVDNGAPPQGKQIGPIRPGEMPDLIGADLPSALAYLRDNDIPYVIIEYVDPATPRGIIVNQTPESGDDADSETTVTLYVSAGDGG